MSAAKSIRVKLDVQDSNVRKKLERLLRSAGPCEIVPANDGGRIDLLILDPGEDHERAFGIVQSLLQVDAVGEIFLTADHPDSAVLMRAMRAGVKEVLAQPLDEEEVVQAFERFKARFETAPAKEPAKKGRVVNVIGSKGGVGTTTVAVNVATGLTQMKEAPKVALVDMNLLFGEIPLFLEIKPNYHWGEITKDVSRLDPTFLMNILAKHGTGVYVLPSPAYLNGHPAATPQTMGHLLSLMRTMFDFIVVDGGQSLDSASLKILEVADAVFLVSILSLPCLSNTKRLLRSFGDLGYPSADRVRVVINRYLKKSEITLEDVEKGIGKKVFWTIPNDYGTTISAINQGKALVQCAAKAPITKNLSGLAQTLAVGESQKKKRWSLFKR